MAGYLHQLKLSRHAENFYIAALVLNPLQNAALRRYAHLLIENGDTHTAVKYLSRVRDGFNWVVINLSLYTMKYSYYKYFEIIS